MITIIMLICVQFILRFSCQNYSFVHGNSTFFFSKRCTPTISRTSCSSANGNGTTEIYARVACPIYCFDSRLDLWCEETSVWLLPAEEMVRNRWCLDRQTRRWCNIEGLVQERRNSSALAMELRLSCTYPSISCSRFTLDSVSSYNWVKPHT